jgi:enamine deaminase RidA (YjgF/YER057c/UK114 family)
MSQSERGREFQEKWGFNDAIVVGDTIYLSGIVVGTAPGETDIKLGYDRVYKQIGAVLKRAGASWDDVVDMTSFHTDVEGQIEQMAAVHKTLCDRALPGLDGDRRRQDPGQRHHRDQDHRQAAAGSWGEK